MFCKNSYIPLFVKKDLKWFERDGLLTYIDRLNYEHFEEDRDRYLKNVKIVNFNIINHQLRSTSLEKSIQSHKTIYKNDLKQMPADDKDAALAACFRSSKKDLYIEKDLRDEYFKTWNETSCKNKNYNKNKKALNQKQKKYFDSQYINSW